MSIRITEIISRSKLIGLIVDAILIINSVSQHECNVCKKLKGVRKTNIILFLKLFNGNAKYFLEIKRDVIKVLET